MESNKNFKKNDKKCFDNQSYKMSIDFITTQKTSPVQLFGGIFSTFGIDKENVKYYNYLEYVESSNHHNNRNLSSNNKVPKESIKEIPLIAERDPNKERLRRILLKKLK